MSLTESTLSLSLEEHEFVFLDFQLVNKPKEQNISASLPAGSLSVVSLRFVLMCRSSTENIIFPSKICVMYFRA